MTDDRYFLELSAALRNADIQQPCLVLDLARLDANIAAIKSRLAPGLALRIVDKSLPCLPLLARIRAAFDTQKFMTFHLPVSAAVLREFPTANLLLGKPMPAPGVRQALMNGALAGIEAVELRIVWLIDTDERLAAYSALAEELAADLSFASKRMSGCIEAATRILKPSHKPQSLRVAPECAAEGSWPMKRISAISRACSAARRRRWRRPSACSRNSPRASADQRAILNLGGSSTALLYESEVGANEVSIGSAFVLPSRFRHAEPRRARARRAHRDADPQVVDAKAPGLDDGSWLLQALGLFPRRGCYLYGGKWMAEPMHPPGMRADKTIGYSTNQQFMALPDDTRAKPGDYAFLRPTQSEHVLQQFGPIAVFSEGAIVERWPVLAPA